jgi:hypothetical protein
LVIRPARRGMRPDGRPPLPSRRLHHRAPLHGSCPSLVSRRPSGSRCSRALRGWCARQLGPGALHWSWPPCTIHSGCTGRVGVGRPGLALAPPFEVVGVAARLVRGTAQPGRMSVTTAIGHDPKWRQRYGRTRRGREPQPPRLGRLTGSTWSCRWNDSLRQTRARICGGRCGTSSVCMTLNLPPIRGVARPVFCIGIRWGVAGRRQWRCGPRAPGLSISRCTCPGRRPAAGACPG